MDDKDFSITTEELGEFFFPIIEAYIKTVEGALSQTKNKDMSGALWKLIPEDSHVVDLKKQHAIVSSWDQFDLFLRREAKFYGFIEEKQSGLVEIDFVIWVFFSPATANSFFNHLVDKPKHFNTKAIITLPFVKLLDPVIKKLDYFLAADNDSASKKISKTLKILDLGDRYLNDQDFTILDSHIKKSIVQLTQAETGQLLKDIKNPNASSILLKKRLNGLFRIGWRYFRSKNELETRYFKKLLLEDLPEREKGLKLMSKKITDCMDESNA
ncbi:hypothetical protein KJ966_06310 [bacterium]|nr:hypothetical protein [bacterium]